MWNGGVWRGVSRLSLKETTGDGGISCSPAIYMVMRFFHHDEPHRLICWPWPSHLWYDPIGSSPLSFSSEKEQEDQSAQ